MKNSQLINLIMPETYDKTNHERGVRSLSSNIIFKTFSIPPAHEQLAARTSRSVGT